MNQPLPSAELTNAFNALYVQASIELEAGIAKVSMMNWLRRSREELTHYQPAKTGDDCNLFNRFQPYTLRAIIRDAETPLQSYDCQDLHLIVPQAQALLDLHRSRCPCEVVNTTSGECYQCNKIHKTD